VRHGSWNRTHKQASDVEVAFLKPDGTVKTIKPFLEGFIQNNNYIGRPVDILQMPDGSLLISDDHNGAVYRLSYSSSQVSQR